jgi:hypothetical protein
MINAGNREAVLKVLMNLETAHDGLAALPETHKREIAYQTIESAHEAVASLLLQK